MSSQNTFQEFDVKKVHLSGSNLIEASAGTGKTYSIAILVLRLLLENKIPIKEILMVTFTKAAVAELEERIRKFVREANKFATGTEIKDKSIQEIVMQSQLDNGLEETLRLLKNAVIYLDETSVLTIHSFCQQTLNEFAFETNQLFSAELLQDTSLVLKEETQKFWRKNVTIIETELLKFLIAKNLDQSKIRNIVREHLNGKRFFKYDTSVKYHFDGQAQLLFLSEIENNHSKINALDERLENYLSENKDEIKQKCEANSNAKKGLLPLIDRTAAFFHFIYEKRDTAYINKLFPEIIALIKEQEAAQTVLNNSVQQAEDDLICFAIQEISIGIKNHKLYNNLLSFDDLITHLHHAFTSKENPKLIAALQQKYKAVFIDEFQDTDKMQYEIFDKAFSENTVLFYIGDPKQSIYAWRKADIGTYLRARNQVDHVDGTNTNFRSTPELIDAMNQLFLPYPDFDTFHFGMETERIQYIPVNAAKNSPGKLLFNGQSCVPISIDIQAKATDVNKAVTQQIVDLLSNDNYTLLDKDGISRRIKPSDIGILVRAKSQGKQLKQSLSQYGIPAITVTDAKVFDSAEAMEVLYILEAMEDYSRSKINRALLCSFTGIKIAQILELDEEILIQDFKNYKTKWLRQGVYATLTSFISDFGIQRQLLNNNTENGERKITNLYQLMEILYKTETRQKLSPIELIDWLKKNTEQDNADDELIQRIENDEDAVKITTIHSSKGLAYNIVIAPSLDFKADSKHETCSFRNEDTSEYISALIKQLTQEQKLVLEKQTEQENRRLFYVTLTRAVFSCFIFKSAGNKNTTLDYFLKANPHLPEMNPPEIPQGYYYASAEIPKERKEMNSVDFRLRQNSWMRLSYSRLAAQSETTIKERFLKKEEDYDYFIFQQLPKGIKTGNLLHFIFENLDFSDNHKWEFVVQKAIKRYAISDPEYFERRILEMLHQIFQAQIPNEKGNFQLSSVNSKLCLHELEFDFPISTFKPASLAQIMPSEIIITDTIWSQVEGMMNGKIDLFFQHNEQYFVLDWKSTYLGPRLENYDHNALSESMTEHNYHLQYLIYTLAIKKYLESRLGNRFDYERDFGGILYLFVRGMRKDKNYGIFYCKPKLSQIERLEQMLS